MKTALRGLLIPVALALAWPAAAQNGQQGWMQFGSNATLSISSTSASVALPAAGSVPPPPNIRVCNTGGNDAYVAFGGAGVVATSANSYVKASTCQLFAPPSSATTLAAIASTSTSTLEIEAGTGSPQAGGGGGSSLVVGTTTISGGSSGNIVYDNGGVIGELGTTGTAGSVVLSISPAFTGAPTITDAGTDTATLTISATGDTNGANLRLLGNGGTTPSKTVRVVGGVFQIVNDGYSASIFSLTDAGALTGVATYNGNTIPTATDTVVLLAATQTLTNKTLASSTNVLGGVTMTLGSDAGGDIYYRAAGGALTRLAVGSGSQVLGVSAGLPAWVAGGGTVTSVICGTGLSGGTITTSGTCAVNLTTASNVLGSDVAMSNVSNYFDGPSMAQGTAGTWFASGQVTITDTAGGAVVDCKLWDGTTVIASGVPDVPFINGLIVLNLSGYLASPAANIRISCKDTSSTSGKMVFNASGNSKDSSIYGFRIQ